MNLRLVLGLISLVVIASITFVLIAAGPEPPKIPSAWSKFDQTVTPRPVFTRTALDTTGNVGGVQLHHHRFGRPGADQLH